MKIRTGHDPFARQEITKRKVKGGCQWCGSSDDKGRIWQYRIEDDQRPGQFSVIGDFCCISCLNIYHG